MQTHPFQDLIDRLDADAREEFEERAGIVEFDGLQPREHAEALALLHVLRRHPLALTGVTAFQLDTDTWVLAHDTGAPVANSRSSRAGLLPLIAPHGISARRIAN